MTPENHRQDDTEEPQDRKEGTLGLSPAQVAGSALAAMSVAFFASWAGTAGTVIGAAVGSVIATVGAATYTWSLRRTSEAARRTAALVRQRALVTGALPHPGAQRQPDSSLASYTDRSPDGLPGRSPDRGSRWRRWDLPWVKVALASVVVMITGMAGITAVEAVTGKPVSALLGHDSGSGTTVGQVVGSDTSSKPSRPSRHRATPSPTARPSESPTPSEQPQQSQPSTVPTPTPSVTPSTGTDVPSPPVESQGVAPQDVTP